VLGQPPKKSFSRRVRQNLKEGHAMFMRIVEKKQRKLQQQLRLALLGPQKAKELEKFLKWQLPDER
jgi:hypothetical protein